MAGEYSRELSAKVFAGQCRLIERGFRQGGPAGYGLRRTLIDQHGQVKGELSKGEHKSLQTDRVILTPGPEEETQNVRLIYKWFVDDSLMESEIAGRLNEMKVKTDLNRDWTRATVHEVLTNEKYIGNNIFNRVSFKLKKKRVINMPNMWIRKEKAFQAIVSPEIFYKAQGMILARSRRFTDQELLDRLKSLFEQQGLLSGLIINQAEGMPSPSVYAHRFGSLVRAYEMVGYTPDRDYKYLEVNRLLRRMHPEVVQKTEQQIIDLGGTVVRDPLTDLLMVNDEFTVSVALSRCHSLDNGSHRWKVRFDTGLMPDITVAVRLTESNDSILDYYLLPRIDFGQSKISLSDFNPIEFESYRFDNLEYLYGMAERARVRRIA